MTAAEPLTLVLTQTYNGFAFQRCKPFSMNKFGERFLRATSVSRHRRLTGRLAGLRLMQRIGIAPGSRLRRQ